MPTDISKQASTVPDQEQDTLRLENEVLRSFVETSRDALFCIEFLEPVDLAAPEPEIIRQVFENECVWRLCNTANGATLQSCLKDGTSTPRTFVLYFRVILKMNSLYAV